MKATQDRVVSLHYTLTDDHGLLLDSSRGRDPLAYLHGHGHIIQGLESALEGCEAGFSGSVRVPPADAYGEYDPQGVFEAPRDQFPPGEDIQAGMRVQAEGPQGIVNFTVLSANDQGVMLDANHPLAGKTLNFEVEVLEVRQATDQELAHRHVHAHGHDH
ncbi:MAG: peptidylprolyl isomerase [Gammaproteobacteria bacterium]|nr:peptidylprolyl isomerase [Gammaproteobacteria bacterium]HRX70796.1 peptidylprolyl isomerase [Candidatus Competibacteraceae bacterium]